MTKTEITDALIIAQISIRSGKPMSAAETADAVNALRVIRTFAGPERVAIHEAIVAGTNLCVAA